jgi:uncharacterized protein YlxP (DUF503 family)
LAVHLAVLTLEIRIPGCTSLKAKRGRLKPLLNELHRTFNLSVAEIDAHDMHNFTAVSCAMVSNNATHLQRALGKIPAWIERRRPDLEVINHNIAFW